MNICLLFALFSSILTHCQLPELALPGQPIINIVNDNNHTIKQEVNITQKDPDIAKCNKFTGKRLKDCMACQSPENFRKNMLEFASRKTRNYLLNLDLNEYYDMTRNYNEEQWQELLLKQDPEFKTIFPQSLFEQKKMIKMLYINAQYPLDMFSHPLCTFHRMWHKYEYNLVPPLDELEQFVVEYNSARAYGTVNDARHQAMLKNFILQRISLFEKGNKT